MKSTFSLVAAFVLIIGCSSRDRYDPLRNLDVAQRDSVLTGIVTYVFVAPPYTSMKDRFQLQHRHFYDSLRTRFSLEKYFVALDGTHFFYLVRPAPKVTEKRGVGGYFKVSSRHLTGFREVFVTPILPENEVKGKCAFLFDEMVKGNIEKYLGMEAYVQWPNKISAYDTTAYEWKMTSENPD